ncbi:NAD-dependent epimerase/dehydratase family protein [Mucilaginibacter pedocola]|uniref:UDP-glucuronate decarboxylase n=1 Tax=Mucilaginibacter pedocola TaxID=1792845 RepID=A0A1S9PEU9_9SPHI|nr:NAD-dependent epimerase/dehydratase family protein [Mucilaginibacter pedocola]OOQ59476.1 UDP-glucuronate decarboxylase [Mucilaginibacter pedocola]
MTGNKIVLEDLEAIRTSAVDWQRFAGKTVLITGANGFLPAYMVESLLYVAEVEALDIRVIGLVRNLAKAKKRFANYADNINLSFIEQDVSAPVELPGNIDFIVHAASQASPKYYSTDPVGTLSANVFGTLNLMNLAREKNIESFLYFSSGEVYGQVDDEHNPVKEDYYGYLDPMQVRACYGESKRMGENICVSYYKQYGISTKVVRPFHTYGPGMLLDDGRVYADFVADILAGRNIEMKSDGSARRAFCYLKDATIGFFTVLLNGQPGEAYNVGNPQAEHSILELAETVVKLGSAGLKVIKVAPVDTNGYLKSPLLRNTPNVDKLLTLGWQPQTDIATGFKRTIDSYLA